MKTQFMRAYPDVDGRSRKRLLRDTSLPVPFVASTPGKKDDGIDLRSGDWSLDRFRNYPVILYGHDFHGVRALPIGLGQDIRLDNGDLKIDVLYDEDDDFAMRCRSKAIKGMMAGSVSWNRKNGKNELLEFSNVNVGLDPDSLPEIERFAMRSMMDDLLDGMGGEKPEKITEAIEALRAKVGEVMASLSEETDSREKEIEEEPEEVEETAVAEKEEDGGMERAVEFYDLTDQVCLALRSIIQEWFWIQGFYFEEGRHFVVLSIEGRLWSYEYSINDDEVTVGEGIRVKHQFTPVNDENDERAVHEDDEDDEEETRAEIEDEAVTEEEDSEVVDEDDKDMRVNEPDDEILAQLEAIFAKADAVSRKHEVENV